MARLAFDNIADRTYEHGVSRGVLYINDTAYVWSGLLSVEESEEGLGAQSYYFDGLKYANLPVSGDFQASVTSLGAPEEFMRIQGLGRIAQGFYIDNQPRQRFDFCYRTEISSAFGSVGHKIHLVYNALATSTGRTNNTITDTHESNSYTWDISTLPESGLSMSRPSAHFIIDSTKTDPLLMSVLEGILYGGVGVLPRLPTPPEILDIYQNWIGEDSTDFPKTFKGKFETSTHELVNLATNPSFETPGGEVTVLTNLAKNPGFEAVGATVEVARNLNPTPLFSEGSNGWYLASNVLRTAIPGVGVGLTFAAAISSSNQAFSRDFATPVLVEGDLISSLFTVSIPESAPRSIPVRPRIRINRTGGQAVVWASGPAVTIAPGDSHEFLFTQVAPVDPGSFSVAVMGDSTQPLDIEDELIIHDGWTVQVNGYQIDKPIVPGVASPDPDLTPEWTGPVNASASRLMGRLPASTAYQGAHVGPVVQSTAWKADGTYSCRIIPVSSSADTWVGPGGDIATGTYRLGMQPGRTYTIAVWCRLERPLTGILSGQSLRARVMREGWAEIARTDPAPNEAGVHLLRLTFTVPESATTAAVRLYAGSSVGNGDVWFDNFTIVEGNVPNLMPFTGSSVSTDPDLSYKWDGPVNGSTSRLVGTTPFGVAAAPSQGWLYQTADRPYSGSFAARYLISTTGAVGIQGTLAHPATASINTIAFWARANGKSLTVRPRIRAALGENVTLPSDKWTLVRLTIAAGTGSAAQTGLLLEPGAGHQRGDIIDLDDFTIVEGEHPDLMPFNPHRTVQIGNQEIRSTWDGTPDSSTSRTTVLDNLPTGARRGDVWDINGRIYVYDGQIWRAGSLSPL